MKLKKVQKTKFRKKPKPQLEVTSNSSNEIKGLLLFAIGALIWFSFSFQNSVGAFGKFISSLLLGFFGLPAFVIPYCIFYFGFVIMFKQQSEIIRQRINCSIVLLIIISAMFHTAHYKIFSGQSLSLWGSLTNYYESGVELKGGGLIGGIISIPFLKVFQTLGTIVILSTIAIIDIVILTDVSLVSALTKIQEIMKLIVSGSFTFANFISQKVSRSQIVAEKIKIEMPLEENVSTEEIQINIGNEKIVMDKMRVIPFKAKLFGKGEVLKKDGTQGESFELLEKNDSKKHDVINLDYKEEKKHSKKDEEFTVNMDGIEKKKEEYKPNLEKGAPKVVDLVKKEDIIPKAEEEFIFKYSLPDREILNKAGNVTADREKIILEAKDNKKKLEDTLSSFGVEAKVVNITVGPAVTRYELAPSPGVKVSKIVGLTDDISLNLATAGIRLEAPIPGKAAIGIEVPNKEQLAVVISDVINTEDFKDFPSKVAFAVGKDISGENIIADIAKMPHLLIAGATGSGKSVCINSLIASILFKAKPDEVKLLMIDPKVVELGIYNGIPHLLIPVVTDPKKAAGALNWAVVEMNQRYKLFAEKGVRDITGYNKLMKTTAGDVLPQIVIIIDELADLMMVAPNDVEDAICRLAQMARAAGMHLVVATQRPSVDVITGIIKANIPSRIAFAVTSNVDSRTILDMAGAEKLLGKGDMLFYPVGEPKPIRVKGCFITDKEVEKIVQYVKMQKDSQYNDNITEYMKNSTQGRTDTEVDDDELINQAMELVIEAGQASASLIQRKFKVGYARAARIIDQLEQKGIVGVFEGSKPRQVLMSKQQLMERQMAKNEN